MTIKQYIKKHGCYSGAARASGIRWEQWWRWSNKKSKVSPAYKIVLKGLGIKV